MRANAARARAPAHSHIADRLMAFSPATERARTCLVRRRLVHCPARVRRDDECVCLPGVRAQVRAHGGQPRLRSQVVEHCGSGERAHANGARRRMSMWELHVGARMVGARYQKAWLRDTPSFGAKAQYRATASKQGPYEGKVGHRTRAINAPWSYS